MGGHDQTVLRKRREFEALILYFTNNTDNVLQLPEMLYFRPLSIVLKRFNSELNKAHNAASPRNTPWMLALLRTTQYRS